MYIYFDCGDVHDNKNGRKKNTIFNLNNKI